MNIIFDLGGVVLYWKPEELIARNFTNPGDRIKVREAFLGHPDWVELDRGTLDIETALNSAVQRTGIPYGQLKKMMEDVPAFLLPREETISLIRRIRDRGHKLYVLSNMHHNSMDYLLKTHDFFTHFDGIVASCKVGMVKPEEQIYRYILDEYNLDPSGTVFIDDMEENVEAAARLGIRPLRFIDADQCEDALKAMNCL